MKKKILAIDFGSTNTLIQSSNSKQPNYNEPTCLVWNKKDKEVFESGYLAYKLLGKLPEDLEYVKPIQRGVVSSVDAAYTYLKKALTDNHLLRDFRRQNVLFSVPTNITEVEKNALNTVIDKLKAKHVYLIPSPLAAGIGAGIDIFSTRGNMLVDIGGETTSIACITMGKIVTSSYCEVSGSSLDKNIQRYIRANHHLIIGEKTAEYIKMRIGTLQSQYDNNLLEISGKDTITGNPHTIIISTAEIQKILTETYSKIVDQITYVLETTLPEIAADIVHTGITISGGGCLLNGTRDYFKNATSIPIHIASSAIEATLNGLIKGGQKLIENYDN